MIRKVLEVLRRWFTIPAARRAALREMARQEAVRIAHALADELVEQVIRQRRPSVRLVDALVSYTRVWVNRQEVPLSPVLRAALPMIESEIRRQAEQVDEGLESRLRYALVHLVQRLVG